MNDPFSWVKVRVKVRVRVRLGLGLGLGLNIKTIVPANALSRPPGEGCGSALIASRHRRI